MEREEALRLSDFRGLKTFLSFVTQREEVSGISVVATSNKLLKLLVGVSGV